MVQDRLNKVFRVVTWLGRAWYLFLTALSAVAVVFFLMLFITAPTFWLMSLLGIGLFVGLGLMSFHDLRGESQQHA